MIAAAPHRSEIALPSRGVQTAASVPAAPAPAIPSRVVAPRAVAPLASTLPPVQPRSRVVPVQFAGEAAGGEAPAATGGPAAPGGGGTPAGDRGEASNNVQLLSNEVWTLIKRRLLAEAERRGRW